MTKRRYRAASACAFAGSSGGTFEEYCVTEKRIRAAAGKALDRRGQPLVIKMTGAVEPYFLASPATPPIRSLSERLPFSLREKMARRAGRGPG